jgi:cytochrome c-type biogenesis protein CcmH
MTLFALLIAAMILAALALLLPAFLKRDEPELTDRQAVNVRIARERLAELQAARDAGELAQAEFEQARGELEQSLAQDLTAQAAASRRGGKALLLGLLGLVPAIALGLYLMLGSPQFLDVAGPGAGRATDRIAGPQGAPPASVEEMVARLEAKLAEAPNDPDGWYMLGRSYMSLQKYPEAVAAYEKLLEVVGEHPAALVALADAVAMTQDGNVLGRPEELLQRALAVAPDDPTALWLAGKAAEEREDYRGAVEYWMRALPAMAEREDLAKELRMLIAQAAIKAGMSVDDLAKLKPGAAVAIAPATGQAPAAAGHGVKVKVRIAPELLGETAPEDTVFVFARAVSGPPMPLAVGRYTLANLPAEIVLDDSSAMSPQLRISGFSEVRVQARVAKGGQPVAQSGDLQSVAVTVAVGSSDVIDLVIDQRVP